MHLDRLIAVLEAVAIAGRAVSAADVQRATNLPRPTCYRLLQTLAEQRLLDCPDDAQRYLIGARLKRLAMIGQSDADVCTIAAPTLAEVANEFGEAVFLSRFRQKTVDIAHVETPLDTARSFIHPGLGSRPLHACSCSKVIAAFADKDFQSDMLAGPLRAFTDHTKTEPDAVKQELITIKDRGYAECVEEIEVGVSSVVPFSVGATGPIRRFTARHRKEIGHALIDVANQISINLQNSHVN